MYKKIAKGGYISDSFLICILYLFERAGSSLRDLETKDRTLPGSTQARSPDPSAAAGPPSPRAPSKRSSNHLQWIPVGGAGQGLMSVARGARAEKRGVPLHRSLACVKRIHTQVSSIWASSTKHRPTPLQIVCCLHRFKNHSDSKFA
jgi:hypothetical protein